MKQRIVQLLIILGTTTVLAGCTINFGGTASTGPDGSVYKTTTNGDTWQQKPYIATTSGKPGLISNLDSSLLVMDPSDSKALYYGTIENGLFYSYDAAESWTPVISLGKVTVSSFAVDPNSKCVLYATVANRVMKSIDCSRSWQQTYFDNELDVTIPTIAVDQYDSHIVYIGTSRGEIIASHDSGTSWQTLKRFDSEVKKIAIAPNDTRIIFVATKDKGLFRSMDKGTSWLSLDSSLKDFPDANRYRDLYVSKVEPGLVVLANNYGLLKTINYGDDWTVIKLITPEKEATINAISVSENNPKGIYYVTNTTFYSTTDGGANWTTKKLPSNRAGWSLVLDSSQPGLIYLGVHQINQ